MTYTKSDYIALSDIIREMKSTQGMFAQIDAHSIRENRVNTIAEITLQLARYFKKRNTKFDEKRFFRDAGYDLIQIEVLTQCMEM